MVTVVTSNVTLEGEQIQNGVNLVAGNRVLLVGQADQAENGIHVVGSGVYGPWTRPADFTTGGEAAGTWTYIEQGTEHAGTIWFCYTNRTCIIDTDEQEWRNVNEDPVGGFDISDLMEEPNNTSLDYIPKHDGTGMRKIKRNDFLLPGIRTETYSYGSTVTINLADPERNFTVTLTGDTMLAVVNAKPGEVFDVKIIQDGTGGHALTWFETINWAGGSAPTLTPTANSADWYQFICTDTNTFDCRYYSQSLGTSSGSSIALGSNVLMYFPLDETSGNRVSAVNSSDILTSVATPGYGAGIKSNAIQFNGTTQYLYYDFGPGDVLDFEDTDFTIALWLNFDSVATNENLIYGPTFALAYYSFESKVRYFCYGDSTTGTAVSTATVSASAWHLFVCTHDSVNNLVKLSIDGETYNTAAFAGGLRTVPLSSRLYVGRDSSGSYFFAGMVDEMGIWNKAFSQAEVTALYNSGAGKFYPFI
ncbi:MAG: LamG domain-containing protein [Planctomycetaceae bacterium]|nr:LamG domain-containing protein [Planctomycetaceae bacterium]